VTWRPTTGGFYTVLPHHSPKLFTLIPVACFNEVNKTCVDIFGILLRSCWKVKARSVVLLSGRTSISSTILRHHISRHLAYTLSRRVRREIPGICAFSAISLYVYGNRLTSLSTTPLVRTSQSNNVFSIKAVYHFRLDSRPNYRKCKESASLF